MVECLAALILLGGVGFAIYFLQRIRKLEKRIGEIQEENARLNLRLTALAPATNLLPGADAPASPPVSPPPLPATVAPAAVAPALPPPQPIPVRAAQPSAPVVAATTTAPPPSQPAIPVDVGPSLAETLKENPLVAWFVGSHMVVRIGVIVLFFGVAFLLKFASDQGWLSLELRLAAAALLGLALVGVGWRLRARRRVYALTLQGAGLGIAYMTVFVAYRLYELLPTGVALALLIALGVACGALSVINNAMSLAVLAITGGFAAPFLIATGGGSHVTLFAYFAALNAAILGIAWFRSWRVLNLVGFVFTVVLATAWGIEYYDPADFASVEPFVVLFFLFYVAIGLLFAVRQPPELRGFVDGPLVFGAPAVTALWQAYLVADQPNGLAWSSLALGGFYLLLAMALVWRAGPNFRGLAESYLALAALFVTLAIPFTFNTEITALVWALEGTGLVWAGLRQHRRFHVLLGGAAQLAAGVWVLVDVLELMFDGRARDTILTDPIVLGGFVVALAGLFSARFFLEHAHRQERLFVPGDLRLLEVLTAIWGMLWWFGVGVYAIERFAPTAYQLDGAVIFLALSAGVGEWLGGRLHWNTVRVPALLLWAVAAGYALVEAFYYGEPLLAYAGWVAWPLVVLVHYWTLYRRDAPPLANLYHPLGLWLIAGLGMLDLQARAGYWEDAAVIWTEIAWIAAPLLLMLGVALLGKRLPWPTGKHFRLYLTVALSVLAALLALWTLTVNLSNAGATAPLPYLPVLNPLSITQLLIFTAFFVWLWRLAQAGIARRTLQAGYVAMAVLIFLWINAGLARVAHQMWGVPFDLGDLLDSALLQAIYSILWTLLAMALMFLGTHRGRRWMWLTGGALLALTVVKLFLVDLSRTGTLARIVSFIVVGLLMLLIGYFAPIPPRAAHDHPPLDAPGS